MASRQRSLGVGLRLLLSRLDGELSKVYEQGGHSFRPRFYPVFQLLLQHGTASVSEIATFLEASQPAATQTLQEMKRLGFISYTAGHDRRERLVALTRHGSATGEALMPIWNAVAAAAAELDRELSHPLSAVLDEALAALRRKPFPQRIAEHLSAERNP